MAGKKRKQFRNKGIDYEIVEYGGEDVRVKAVIEGQERTLKFYERGQRINEEMAIEAILEAKEDLLSMPDKERYVI